MITITNRQRKIKFNLSRFKRNARKCLELLDYKGYDLGVLFTTNKTIHWYNKEYRHKDKPTDILSFSYHSHLKPGERIVPESADDKNLGDLIISLEYVIKQLPDLETSLDDRLQVLLVHGICHLLGYDHETEKEYEVMHTLEKKLLKQLT